jgi:thymidylate kinase
VWETYEKLAEEYPNFHVIDGTMSKETVHQEIKKILTNYLGNGN